MRVWAFPSFYPIDRPGQKWTGIFAHRQFQGLIANGAELQVIIPTLWYPPLPFAKLDKSWQKLAKNEPYPLERTLDGIIVHHPRINNNKPSAIFRKTHQERYVDSVCHFFKQKNIKLDPRVDIFYSQWLPESVHVQAAAHKLGLKSAILAVGDDVLTVPGKPMFPMEEFRKLWTEADCRLAVARYLGNEANLKLQLNLPFSAVYRGVEHDIFKPCSSEEKETYRKEFNFPSDKLVILSTGTAIVRKGWLDLLDALEIVVKTNKNFVLAAVYSGVADIKLKDEAEKRGLSNHFIRIGEVPPTQIRKIYNAADIFCLPSHWEGIANAVVEALSSGLPVITTHVCGHPELITTQENGILVPPKEPTLLARELISLLEGSARREQLGKTARHFIVNKWGSFTDNAKNLYNILDACLKN